MVAKLDMVIAAFRRIVQENRKEPKAAAAKKMSQPFLYLKRLLQ